MSWFDLPAYTVYILLLSINEIPNNSQLTVAPVKTYDKDQSRQSLFWKPVSYRYGKIQNKEGIAFTFNISLH